MKFVATDGTEFATRKEWRKYEFETQYTFKNKSNENNLVKTSIGGQPFDIANLNKCVVVLADHTEQVQIDDCTNCEIFVGACGESVFVRNCDDCTFYIACKQLRVRECTHVSFSLYSQTEPVIEMSNDINFSPFSGGYHDQADHMASAHLDPQTNFWWGVYDFNDPDKSGHNYTVEENPIKPWWPLGDGCEQVILQTKVNHAPLPSTLDDSRQHSSPIGPTTSETKPAQSFQSFDIRKTTQEDAQKALEKDLSDLSMNDTPKAPPSVTSSISSFANSIIPSALPPPAVVPNKSSAKQLDPAWQAVRLGIRYTPMALAIQYKETNDSQRTTQQKDIIIGDLEQNDNPDTLLARLSLTYSDFLDFDNKLSKKQVLRLLGMLIDHSRNTTSLLLPPPPELRA